MAGRPIPPELYRPALGTEVLLALHDRGVEVEVQSSLTHNLPPSYYSHSVESWREPSDGDGRQGLLHGSCHTQ